MKVEDIFYMCLQVTQVGVEEEILIIHIHQSAAAETVQATKKQTKNSHPIKVAFCHTFTPLASNLCTIT